MTESDPSYWATLIHNSWVVFLAMWGGLVAYYQRFVEESTPFSWVMLGGELTTSALAGLLAFYACLEMEVSNPMTAIVVALAGLAGGKILKVAEKSLRRRFERMVDYHDQTGRGE